MKQKILREQMKEFFKDFQKMNAKELVLKWKNRISFREWNNYKIKLDNRTVATKSFYLKFNTGYLDIQFLIYVYNQKVIKVESYVKELPNFWLNNLLKKVRISTKSNKYKLFVLNNGGYCYTSNCSYRYLLAKKLGLVTEEFVNILLKRKSIPTNDWIFIKRYAYSEYHHVGKNYRKENFYNKDLLKFAVKLYLQKREEALKVLCPNKIIRQLLCA